MSNEEQCQRHSKVLIVIIDLVVERGKNCDDSLGLLVISLVSSISVSYLLPETVSEVAMQSISR